LTDERRAKPLKNTTANAPDMALVEKAVRELALSIQRRKEAKEHAA